MQRIPLIITRDLSVFPGAMVPFNTSDPDTKRAITSAYDKEKLVFFAFPEETLIDGEKDPDNDKRQVEISRTGTVVKIMQIFKLQNGSIRILGEALQRGYINTLFEQDHFSEVTVDLILPNLEKDEVLALEVLMNTVKQYFKEYSSMVGSIPQKKLQQVTAEQDPDRLVDTAAHFIQTEAVKKNHLIQESDPKKRLQELAVLLQTEQELMKLNESIQNKVKEKFELTQREFFLNEQIRQINKELGRDVDEADEAEQLYKQLEAKKPSQEILDKARKETNRLKKLQPSAPEAGVLRTYLEWLADLPWGIRTEDSFDIKEAEKILNEDHYNMKRPKERILDYMAVRRLHPKLKGPILCFVGPPGTGKTSLGRSVARALGKKFIRISLGGVRDEAEIRGHRKTYVGALPGRILQSIKRAETANPVFLLDEIDKISSDFRGDPASALLEVLDPEQNASFTDHYLEVPFDLSQVLFIATANSLHTVPSALRDRMEIIEIPGYSDIEKYHIARKFLITKQLKENGLESAQITFHKQAIYSLIRDYTMESGVRNLERTVSSVLRKIAREYLEKKSPPPLDQFSRNITARSLPALLGTAEYVEDQIQKSNSPGVAHGLAWTEMGGKLLTVEVSLLPGDGRLILTGNLGEVMKESARISLSYLQSHCEAYGIDPERFRSTNIHVHVPQGAIPKDGPSAGITLLAAMCSAFMDRRIVSPISMTGEITLTGVVLSIGGVKEKLLASYRHGITTVLLPAGNRRDLDEDIPRSVIKALKVIHVETVQEALAVLLDIEKE